MPRSSRSTPPSCRSTSPALRSHWPASSRRGRLVASTDPALVAEAENVVVVIGTPVDEHLNPDPEAIPRALADCAQHFVDGQLMVLRSTVFPGVTALVEQMVRNSAG